MVVDSFKTTPNSLRYFYLSTKKNSSTLPVPQEKVNRSLDIRKRHLIGRMFYQYEVVEADEEASKAKT